MGYPCAIPYILFLKSWSGYFALLLSYVNYSCANEHFFVSGNQRVDDMGIKISPKISPDECGGYVKYEEAEVDRLIANLKTSSCSGGRTCGIQ